jgi:hypothetical protein
MHVRHDNFMSDERNVADDDVTIGCEYGSNERTMVANFELA